MYRSLEQYFETVQHFQQGMEVHTFDASTGEAGAGRSLREFQDSQGYSKKLFPKKQKEKRLHYFYPVPDSSC